MSDPFAIYLLLIANPHLLMLAVAITSIICAHKGI